MIINLLICLLSIGCTILVMDTLNKLRTSSIINKYSETLNNISHIILEAETVSRLLDDENGSYIASGFLLEDEDYFKICKIMEDLTEVNI